MSKKLLLLLIVLALPMVSVAGAQNNLENNIVVSQYDNEETQAALAKIPLPADLSVKEKMVFLSAQMERKKGNFRQAIRLYKKVLDERPDFVRARIELALCYGANDRWYRADYNLRLAMAAENLPEDVQQMLESYRYLVRKNKNWDFWFDYGDVPDTRSSLSNGDGGCGGDEDGRTCETITDSKDTTGLYFAAGADYEFKLSDQWRWKSDAAFGTNVYLKDKKNDDLALSASTGPRYVWDRGDIWFAGVASRAWYGQQKLGWSYGAKIDTNYDLTRKLTSGLILMVTDNKYDEYDMFNGQTYSAEPHFTYYIDSTKYISLRGDLERQTAKESSYANYEYGFGIGFGMELPYAFIVSFEPFLAWIDYDGEQDIERNGQHMHVKERVSYQKYTFSVANTHIELLGFMPVVNISYTEKESNIPMPGYNKWSYGISIKRKF